MRRTRSDLVRVGLFVTVAGTILVAGLLWLAGAHLFRPVHTYRVLFERSVSGLNAGANVEYQGVVVGRVRDIRLTGDIPPRVAVIVDLEPGTPVRRDTTAALVGSLVTGIQFIQLQGGSAADEALAPGGTIPGTTPSLEAFRERLTDIADRVSDILRGLQEDVFTRENSAKFNALLVDLGGVATSLNTALQAFREKDTTKGVVDLVRELSAAARTPTPCSPTSAPGARRSTATSAARSAISTPARVRPATSCGAPTRRSPGPAARSMRSSPTSPRRRTAPGDARRDPQRSSVLLWGRAVPARERER
jgi:ABC-type transporter Mla subunit MlaD